MWLEKMVGFRYLSSAHLQGFSRYKYSSIDNSPLSKYVMHPFWNSVVKLAPMWMAPNVLTLSGWSLLLVNLGLLSFYDWDYGTTGNAYREPIPSWVWLCCGIFHFLSHTLDGIDGKQARRTGATSPLGELFDHGLDSWAAIMLPMCLYSGLGREEPWGGSPHEAFAPCLAGLAGFLLSHWEKYITGTLYLPWLYDAMQLGCCLGYLVTSLFGVELWQFYVLPGVSCGHTLKWALIGGFFVLIPNSLWNIYQFYNNTSPEDTQQSPPKRLSFIQAIAPWTPFILMTVLYTAWVKLSYSDIMERDPRVVLFSMGIVFSNIACRLIIAQMSGQPCELFNPFLVPLALALGASLYQPQYEHTILLSYGVIVLLAHLHYGVCVVQELCEHLKINCFTVSKDSSPKQNGHQ